MNNKHSGLWIDHQRAVIALASNEDGEVEEILSHEDRQPGAFAWGEHPIAGERLHRLSDWTMETKLTHTRNSLPEKTRIEVAALLQERLTDSIDLMMQAKQAHWNVKGPNFIALHELFDKVFTDTGKYVDTIAERIVQLGGTARGTIRVAAQQSSLPEYALDISSASKHIAGLAHALAFYGELIRKAIEQANKLEDADTADIFTEVSRGTDFNLWFVEAHEQSQH